MITDASGNTLWLRDKYRCNGISPSLLQKRRKYEVLKHTQSSINGTSKKQAYANIVKNPNLYGKSSINKTTLTHCDDGYNPPTCSDVPGTTWDLTVNKELRNTPLINYKVNRSIPMGGPSKWTYT